MSSLYHDIAANLACRAGRILLHLGQRGLQINVFQGPSTSYRLVVRWAVATMQSGRAFLPVIAFRWLFWLFASAMLSLGAAAGAHRPLRVAAVIGLSGLYMLVWSLRLPVFARQAQRWPALLLADLVVSMLPVWFTGGWASPFLPFVYGALILPALLFHWPGVLAAAVAYIVVDQIMGWAFWQRYVSPPLSSPGDVLRYLAPLAVASVWPLGRELRHWQAQRRSPQTSGRTLPARVPAPLGSGPMRPMEMSSGTAGRPSESGAATAWSLVRTRSQTLEHPSTLGLLAGIREIIAQAEEQGLTVHLVVDGAEPALPQDHIQLLVKAVEVGLDNIRRHAHTGEAEVTLAAAREPILLTIRDHGIGLLDGTAEPPGFHQIRRLRYRLEEVEGSLDAREAETGGVLLTVQIPRVQ